MKLFPNPKTLIFSKEKMNSQKISKVTSSFDEHFNNLLYQMFEVNQKEGIPLMIEKSDDITNYEGYKLKIEKEVITIIAKQPNGAFYGLLTLRDILNSDNQLCLEIEDYPDLAVRGVMLDISRSKVPTLDTLKKLVVMFATLRYNHLELYIEGFSFEYQSFKHLLSDNNYLCLQDYLELEKFAQEYYIDFVPNQNGFGHMSDWLAQDEYKKLAECEDGFDIWGSHRAPSTLDPTNEESVNFVKKMYSDMLPYTSSRYFNMNFDEPYELGHGKSFKKAQTSSIEDVYIDYFTILADDVRKYNKIPMLWGDVLVKHPEKITKLPKDVIFIDWGYNKDYPFEKHAKMLFENNVNYILAPGTSSWSTITSRMLDMSLTIIHSAKAAKKYNGLGILVTDWGDIGHLQYLPVSYLGFIFGGLLAWGSCELDDAIGYLKKMLKDDALCEAILELAQYHLLEGDYRDYGSRLFSAILWAEHARNQLNQIEFYQTRIFSNLVEEKNCQLLEISFNKAQFLLEKANCSLETSELKNSLKLLKVLLSINRKFTNIKNNIPTSFDNEIKILQEYLIEHKYLWYIRNNPNGYEKSANRIQWLIEILTQMTRKENVC